MLSIVSQSFNTWLTCQSLEFTQSIHVYLFEFTALKVQGGFVNVRFDKVRTECNSLVIVFECEIVLSIFGNLAAALVISLAVLTLFGNNNRPSCYESSIGASGPH